MASSVNRVRSFFVSHRFHLIGGVLIAATVIAAVLTAWERRQETISSYHRELTNLSVTLAEQTARSMQAVDLVLQEMQAKNAAAGIDSPAAFEREMASEAIHQFLANRLSVLPQAQGMGVIDAAGGLISSSRDWPAQRFDFSDRDFFQHFRDKEDGGVFVSVPVRSRVTGAWMFSLVRRITGPHGEFLGLVVGVVDLGYFAELYKAITLLPGGSVAVFRDDGTMLVRYPQVEAMIGRKLPATSKWYPAVAKGGGTYTALGSIDGVARVVSIRTMHTYPFVVAVTLPEDAALASWRWFALVVAGAASFVVICFGLLFGALARSSRKLECSNRELYEARMTLSDALESISESIMIWDHDDRLVMCNQPSRVLYGENADLLVPGQRFEDILRSAAYRGVYANVAGHVEEWLAERVAAHRQPSGAIEQRLADGRTVLVVERRMKNGGIAGLRVDITKLKQIEAKLRGTMEHLNRVQRIAGIGSTTENLATREYEWSAGACAIFGIDSSAAGKTVEYMRQFYHPADRAKVIEAGELARLKSAPAAPLEYRIVRPDGAVRWVYRQNDIQHDPEGGAISRIVTFKDITELKEKEIELQEAMNHLNRVQRIAGIASIEIDLMTETEQIKWFPSACKLFGLDPDSVDSTPEFLLKFVHPDDRTKVKKASDRANGSGAAAPPLEYRIIRPDGAERTVYRENAIQYDESGDPIRRIVTYKDITEIKATEARLHRTQDDLNHAQRLAKVGSDVWDMRTGEVTWSEETYRIFGVDPDTFTPTAENFVEFVAPEDRPGLLARRKEVLEGKRPVASQMSIRRPDGELRHIYSEAELVVDEKGAPVRWVGMRQDVTAQRLAEQSLRQAKEAAEAANVAKSQFLANTSHELRTPLNAVIGYSEMLVLGIAGRLGSKQKECVALIHDSGKHLLSIINDILDLAHVDSGRFELHEEFDVDMREVIGRCIALMKERANAAGLHLSAEIEDNLPLLAADPTRLKQILLNLMSNAIKFTGPGGSIVVTGRRDREGCMIFEVRDTGPGMTPDEVEIALEPFGQVDSGNTRQHEGTGLGLPLARRLAELHGGLLHVSSQKGNGTTVSVTLPASRTVVATTTATWLEAAVGAA